MVARGHAWGVSSSSRRRSIYGCWSYSWGLIYRQMYAAAMHVVDRARRRRRRRAQRERGGVARKARCRRVSPRGSHIHDGRVNRGMWGRCLSSWVSLPALCVRRLRAPPMATPPARLASQSQLALLAVAGYKTHTHIIHSYSYSGTVVP
jgi:hypothetical protein